MTINLSYDMVRVIHEVLWVMQDTDPAITSGEESNQSAYQLFKELKESVE